MSGLFTFKTLTFKTTFLSIASVAIMGFISQSAHALTIHSSRSSFETLLKTSITDDYQSYEEGDGAYGVDPQGWDVFDDATMSAVLGETKYMTTALPDTNVIIQGRTGEQMYCAGCNGTFELDFTSTSVGSSSGVFGVGFDIFLPTNYFAYATFGDGSTQNFNLAGLRFFGLTSDLQIKSLHLGLVDGGAIQDYSGNLANSIIIDNLTIGSNVPTPAFVFPMLSGLFAAAKRHKQKHLDT